MRRLDVQPFADAAITRADRREDSGTAGFQRVERASGTPSSSTTTTGD
jgi:hypothetical protein